VSYASRLERLEARQGAAALDALAAELAAPLDEPYGAIRAELAAEVAHVEALYAQLGSWEAVAATLAADLGVPVGELRAGLARWEDRCPPR
jgi:hypothetical protein